MAHMDIKRPSVVGVEDLVLLPQLSDKAIMENLKLRHSKDIIYTNIGPVLLSVNPFKKIPNIYSEERIAFFRSGGKSGSGVIGNNHGGPHIFGLAEETYRTMVSEEENQCVIISGESGAGKTEASKQIMQYISAVSDNTKEMQRVKHIILESNPLLEAFGNAKTVRNDNSSRFGKFFEIFFDRMGGPVGGRMSNFLLEKSRVVGQQKGERNFHVFYQMCQGANSTLRERLRLRPPGEFFYLNQGSTLNCTGIDDAKEWENTLAAMEAMCLSTSEQQSIFNTLALILHLGQLKFTPSATNDENGALMVSNRDELHFCASLLGVETIALERALTWKLLEMGSSEVVNVPLDMQQCQNARDAIAKVLYHHLFDFVVQSVNMALGNQKYDLMFGVLDIYGFEIFDRNGFEQFCINYVNEKLQQIFIELTLKVEQEEYVREKIPWEEIKYFNNKIVCDLIESAQPPGLFAVIDDVCATMAKEKESVADIKMLDKLDAVHAGNPHFHRTERGFFIKHYAGDVYYNAEGFTNRNKDLLSADVIALLSSSSNSFLLKILKEILVDVSQDSRGGYGSGKKKNATTVGFKMRQQAANLVKTLMGCNPHYVRTIKPNDEKRPNFMDESRVLHQVKYLGLLENIRVRRAGYSYRQYFDKFLKRFKYLSPETFPRPFKGSDSDACASILRHVGNALSQASWQLGQHKVFIRQPQHLFTLEDLREAALDGFVFKIQRAWSRYRHNKEGILLKAGIGRLYTKAGKARRADSVFRPFFGDYLDYRNKLKPIHTYVDVNPIVSAWMEYWTDDGKRYYHNFILQQSQWERPRELTPQKTIFTGLVERVVDHQRAQLQENILILTDLAVYIIHERVETIVQPAAKPTKKNLCPAPPTTSTVTRYILQKRLDLRLLSGISVTNCADTVLVLHFYQPSPPYRQVEHTPSKRASQCKCCGVKLSPAAKKQNCPGCGRLCCIKNCLRHSRPLPTLLGHTKLVHVCPNCFQGEPFEPVEDVVMMTPMKTEVVALMRKLYRQLMGNKVSLCISNVLNYQLFGESKPRQLVVNTSASIAETSVISSAPSILTVGAPVGISQEKIQAIETVREQRRIAAAERRRKEEEEERNREATREREREETHRRIVEERKKAKVAAEEKEEIERLQREQAAFDRRVAEARIVQERSTR